MERFAVGNAYLLCKMTYLVDIDHLIIGRNVS